MQTGLDVPGFRDGSGIADADILQVWKIGTAQALTPHIKQSAN